MNLDNKKNIVFISISSDLYGSSKLLLTLVLELKKTSSAYNPIVCLPLEEGPLKQKLIDENIEIIETPVLKLTRSMLKSLKFGKFFKEYKQAKKILETELKGRDILCIQSNTLATLLGSFYCYQKKIYHIFHVHEIMDRPWFVKYFFSFIQLIFANKIIYNSIATETFYNNTLKLLKKKSVMIFNGVERNVEFLNEEERNAYRLKFFNATEKDCLIGLIGRFNRLKGHKLLMDSFINIKEKFKNTKLCFIGSPPVGQEYFLENIKRKIEDYELSNKIHILPFQENIYKIIDTLDIVVVPSTEAESFGIIAVEAMLSKKAVIASDIGGLTNIIHDKETGVLFEPNNKQGLTNAIISILQNQKLKQKLEVNAYHIAKQDFSVASMRSKFLKIYDNI